MLCIIILGKFSSGPDIMHYRWPKLSSQVAHPGKECLKWPSDNENFEYIMDLLPCKGQNWPLGWGVGPEPSDFASTYRMPENILPIKRLKVAIFNYFKGTLLKKR